jgi:hypothetical protein
MQFQEDRIMFNKNWEKLVQNGFNKIFSYMKKENNSTPYQMQMQDILKQYDLVYQICMSRNPEIRKLCEVNLEKQLRTYLSNILEESGNKIDLKNFISNWISYSRVLYSWLKKTFKYFDKMKKMINRDSSLESYVYKIYREEIYEKSKDNLFSEFESIVNAYRTNKQIDINICKEYANFLKLFKEDNLIEKYLTSTENYFNDLVQEHINSTFNDFMNFFWMEIDKEKKFLSVVFPEEQVVALSRISEVVYYKNFGKLLSKEDGFLFMLSNYDTNIKEKLKCTFDIFISNGNSFSMMTKLFKDFIKKNFKEKIIIKENLENNPQIVKPRDVLSKTNFIEDYINFQRNILTIINYCFSNNNIMNLNFKEGLADIQGTLDNANLAYVLPYFFDEELTKNISNEERKKQIELGLEIFNCVPDKDVFIDIYSNLLASRILSLFNKNNTINQINYFDLDLETNIIKVFEKECGNELVQKLNYIINDYNLNENEIKEKFSSFLKEYNNTQNDNNDISMEKSGILNTQINIRILSSENWPSNIGSKKALLPEKLNKITNDISSFYHKIYPGRILEFSLKSSYAILSTILPKTKINFDIKCNTFQAIILLKFNEIYYNHNNIIKKEDLISMLKFEANEDFFKYIKPFIERKVINEDKDCYSLNCDLDVQNGECLVFHTVEENEIKKKEKQEIDRTYPVDGTIVKTVKDNKTIMHKNLILKVLDALCNFSIKEEFIEKRINSLIEREIIFKSKQDPNLYVYNEQ